MVVNIWSKHGIPNLSNSSKSSHENIILSQRVGGFDQTPSESAPGAVLHNPVLYISGLSKTKFAVFILQCGPCFVTICHFKMTL